MPVMNNHIEGTTPDGVAWKIHYEVCGSGDDLILLHGGGPGATGRSNYGKNIDALARAFRVWVIDFPGWGQSSKNLNAFGGAGPFQNGARAVIAFMDALGIGRAHLVGNSFGGSAALCVAILDDVRFSIRRTTNVETQAQAQAYAAGAEARCSRGAVRLVQPAEHERYLRRMRVVGIVGGAEEGRPGAMAMDVADHVPIGRQDRRAIDKARGRGLVDDGKVQGELARGLVPENKSRAFIR